MTTSISCGLLSLSSSPMTQPPSAAFLSICTQQLRVRERFSTQQPAPILTVQLLPLQVISENTPPTPPFSMHFACVEYDVVLHPHL
ncbi:hypothetical protein BDN72DRAFT_541322 [Pluteus cervinus]|uniref:Uncharacterized protein n=1 Tax=Pluteus cervinus TaxID=181527 RepID=A0ACD3A3I3_9AGAR|nr:hypothetical protein BDN72DRAFT_541322 [Pluteus cervinus]